MCINSIEALWCSGDLSALRENRGGGSYLSRCHYLIIFLYGGGTPVDECTVETQTTLGGRGVTPEHAS